MYVYTHISLKACIEMFVYILQVMFKRAGMVGGAAPNISPLVAQQVKTANSSTAKLTPPTTYGELNCSVDILCKHYWCITSPFSNCTT